MEWTTLRDEKVMTSEFFSREHELLVYIPCKKKAKRLMAHHLHDHMYHVSFCLSTIASQIQRIMGSSLCYKRKKHYVCYPQMKPTDCKNAVVLTERHVTTMENEAQRQTCRRL